MPNGKWGIHVIFQTDRMKNQELLLIRYVLNSQILHLPKYLINKSSWIFIRSVWKFTWIPYLPLATFIFSKNFCGKKFLLIKLIKFYFSNGFLSKFQKVILRKSFATQICSLLCPIDDKNGRGHPGTRGGTLQNGSCLNS